MIEAPEVIDATPPTSVVDGPVLAPGDTPLAPQPDDIAAAEAAKAEAEKKPVKTPEQKALEKAERKINMLYAQRAEAREELRTMRERHNLQSPSIDDINGPEAGDSGNLTLSRSDLDKLIEREAKRLAPTIKEQADAVEMRGNTARALRDEMGAERFQELTDDLADVLGQEAQLLILETDSPKALIEYLTDPEHEAETRKIARLSPYQQGMQLGLLAASLKAKRNRTPQASDAPKPLEALKSQGSAGVKPLALLSDAEFAKRRQAQIASRR